MPKPKPKKKKLSKPSRGAVLTVVMALRGGSDAATKRALVASRLLASPRPDWVLVDDGSGASAALSALRLPNATLIERPRALGDWAALCSAASLIRSPWCLLLPAGPLPSAKLLKRMRAQSAGKDLVLCERGDGPAWAHELLTRVWALPKVDLGAPLLIRTELLQRICAHHDADEPLLGARLLRAALAGESRAVAVDSPEPARALSALDVLGVDAASAKAQWMDLGRWAVTGLALVLMGALVFMPRSASLGLAMLGSGLFILASYLGKEA